MTFGQADWRADRVVKIPGGPIEITFIRRQVGQWHSSDQIGQRILRLTAEEWTSLQVHVDLARLQEPRRKCSTCRGDGCEYRIHTSETSPPEQSCSPPPLPGLQRDGSHTVTRCDPQAQRWCVTMRLALADDSPIKEVVPGLLGWEQRLSLGPDFQPPSYCPWCGAKILIQPRVTGQPNEV